VNAGRGARGNLKEREGRLQVPRGPALGSPGGKKAPLVLWEPVRLRRGKSYKDGGKEGENLPGTSQNRTFLVYQKSPLVLTGCGKPFPDDKEK